MNLVTYFDGKRIVIPEQRLEPPPGWYDGPEEDDTEEEDDGIDLDNGRISDAVSACNCNDSI